jgi:hypothetical protein
MQQLDSSTKNELVKVAEVLDTTTSSSNSRLQKKRSLEVLKGMNDAHEEEACQAKWRRAHEEKSETTTRRLATSRAMEMVNAATGQTNKKAKMNHRSIEDVLGVAGPKKVQSSQAISSSKPASTLHLSTTAKRRPTIPRNMAGFITQKAPSSQQQVDIRDMFARRSK